jgi:glycosyltransferase involved in cell wall biosynthesis
MPRLSVAIIAFNEEKNLGPCLRSVAFADEIVLVDNGSSDRTRAIAVEHGARVIEVTDWPGFGPQKNRAIDACTGDWILALDADERIEEPLRAEIEHVLARSEFDVYAMPRRSTYCGRFIRHSGWWPDYVTRLFRRGTARYSDARVHERLLTERPVGKLRAPLTHFSFRSMDQVLGKMNRYSSEGARMLVERGRTPRLASAIGHGLAAFVRTYVLRLGFLDGRLGFLLAVSNAEGSYYRYVKAMLAAETRRDDVE